jgi:TIR domain
MWTAVGSCAGVVAAAAAVVPLIRSRKPRANLAVPSPVAAARAEATSAVSYDVFISYSAKDRVWVRELAGALQGKGVRVVYDELTTGPGDVIVHALDKAILASANGLLVYSKAAKADRWVAEEYAALMYRSIQDGQLFIPVTIEKVSLPPLAESRYSADFSDVDPAAYDRLVEQIAKAVKRPLSTQGRRPRSRRAVPRR